MRKKPNGRWSPAEIKALRVKLGETQEQFAQRLGVSFTTANRWERGKRRPNKLGLTALDAAATGGRRLV